MKTTTETIEVRVHTPDEKDNDVNYKELNFEYNGFNVSVDIPGEGNYISNVWITVTHKKIEDGIAIYVENKNNNELQMSIDHNGGMTETKKRSYNEWLNLENLEKALKIIGNVLKR